MNVLDKIADYQKFLYHKTQKDELIFDNEIQLGDNLFLSGICLGDEDSKVGFGIVYMSVAEVSSYISFDVLSDNILNQILHKCSTYKTL